MCGSLCCDNNLFAASFIPDTTDIQTALRTAQGVIDWPLTELDILNFFLKVMPAFQGDEHSHLSGQHFAADKLLRKEKNLSIQAF